MPFISREFLRLSLEELAQHRYSPLLLVSIPCMLAAKIPSCNSNQEAESQATTFGSQQENGWLNRYFRLHGGPPGKPFYMPATKSWVDQRYAATSLQRQRTTFNGTVFFHPSAVTWALRPNAAKELKDRVIKQLPPVSLTALMGWMWRGKEVSGDLPSVLDTFTSEIGFDHAGLVPDIYSKDVPTTFVDAGLSSEALPEGDVTELVGLAPATPQLTGFADLVSELEDAIRKRHFALLPDMVRRILGGWLVGDIVVLVGPTGSGKTSLALALQEALEKVLPDGMLVPCMIQVNRDYDAAEFFGYENLAGQFVQGQFTKQALLQGEPTAVRYVVLDEWNLSQVDAYLAPLLSVVETGRSLNAPGRIELGEKDTAEGIARADTITRCHPALATGELNLPQDTFILATCNSWTEEPESRHPLSGPVKRRCRILTMPNVLFVKFSQQQEDGIIELCDDLLEKERSDIQKRRQEGRRSIWDDHRVSQLNVVQQFSSLSAESRDTLMQLCRALLSNEQTRDSFTIGILRDVLLAVVYAAADRQLAALGEQIADKILHQVQGEIGILNAITAIAQGLPNSSEINALAERMGATGTHGRIRPLV